MAGMSKDVAKNIFDFLLSQAIALDNNFER